MRKVMKGKVGETGQVGTGDLKKLNYIVK
jgi:hypothetical protein